MESLKAKGTAQARKIYMRHGMDESRVHGVSVADMKAIAKTIKGDQALACELYATGVMDAMYLAGIVARGSLMTKKELDGWAEGAAGQRMISESTVPWVTVESPHARELALKWMGSKKEHMAASGWYTYAGLVSILPDEQLDLKEVEALMKKAVAGVHEAPDRVRLAMNAFVICVGSYVTPLNKQAKAAARDMGTVSADRGETACKIPAALAYIEKVEAAGKAGIKKKGLRC
jgi:3-methyladenine DNA glycosylase AlkD